MKQILLFIWNSEAIHLLLITIYVRVVASLEAPTKDSSMYYKNFFNISNAVALQWERINPKIENSPNWKDAVDKVINGSVQKYENTKDNLRLT